MSLNLCDRITAVKKIWVSVLMCATTVWVTVYVEFQTQIDKLTCLSFMRVTLSLLTDKSHTHTTVLVPPVTMVVGLGEAAHNVSPQSHKLSHTAKV